MATVQSGAEFRVECKEWFDGTIHNDDSANDVRDCDLSIVHMLSGPLAVEGAQPGDLLMVDILDVGPVPQEEGPVAGQGWRYTGVFARENGGGFLTDESPRRSRPSGTSTASPRRPATCRGRASRASSTRA